MDELLNKSKSLAIDMIRFIEGLDKSLIYSVIGKQLLRSGTSVGANYRAARRSKSTADFIAKLGIVEEEADECLYWLELLVESKKVSTDKVEHLVDQSNQVLSMTVASIKTSRMTSRSQ